MHDELNKALVALGIGSVGPTYWETLTNSVDEVDFASSFLEVLAQAGQCAVCARCRFNRHARTRKMELTFSKQ